MHISFLIFFLRTAGHLPPHCASLHIIPLVCLSNLISPLKIPPTYIQYKVLSSEPVVSGKLLCLGPQIDLSLGSGYTVVAAVKWCPVNIGALFFTLQFRKLGKNVIGNPKAGNSSIHPLLMAESGPSATPFSGGGSGIIREAKTVGAGLGNQPAGLLTALLGSAVIRKVTGKLPICAFPGLIA